MRRTLFVAAIVGLAGLAAWCQEGVVPKSRQPLRGGVRGKVTIEMTTNRIVYPLVGFPLYLFTLRQSKSIRDLQRQSYERCRRNPPSMYDVKELHACSDYLWKLYELAPKLPRTAMTKTDKKGFYRFDNLVPGRTYQIVGIVPDEGIDFAAVAGVTPPIKAGKYVEVNLRANDPWNEGFDVSPRDADRRDRPSPEP